ncbi:MAG: bifunctional [glutamate--ammonia ligase]-adenylyl-L-tyrosine phosphorylase/[glutamate--ammonia-ligase] adenylyltransferase [Gammaproteobacteria bacterium]
MMNIETPDLTARIFRCSPWVEEKCRAYPQWLAEGLEKDFQQIYHQETYQQQLAELNPTDFVQLAKQLRQFRSRAMVRIIWRMSLGWAPLEETLSDLSSLADSLVQFAEQKLFVWLCTRYGAPQNAQGDDEHLVVVALGKLGGQELNLSSDIDLLFAYPEDGKLINSDLSYAEFYLRLAQQLIKVLNELTVDGYVFRIDMRLRPFGESGPLVASFTALENYYQANGREWERYALIKARPITGSESAKQEFNQLIRPFVYRRYVDYSVLQSLREMHEMIQQEVQYKGLHDHVKLGAGGIRSIEFIVQMHQLMRGGRNSHLQQTHFFTALNALVQAHILTEEVAGHLQQAYIFLRQTEHALQAVHDQQTHVLPQQTTEQERLAYALNFPSWDLFLQTLNAYRQQVANYFEMYSAPPEMMDKVEKKNQTLVHVAQIWQNQIEESDALLILEDLGFSPPQPIYNLLRRYAELPQCSHLTPQALQRLLACIPALLNQIVGVENPELTLTRMLDVIMAVVKRSAYLVLLLENPPTLRRVITLCTASSWLTQELIHYPALLDELLSPELLRKIPTRQSILQELKHALAKIRVTDVEQQLDVLRYIKRTNFLRVAAGELNGLLNASQASRALTTIAEAIIHMVFVLVWRQQINPPADRNQENTTLLEQTLSMDLDNTKKLPFAIIAYGKLASRELNYTSDLDCVFIYEPQDAAALKLIQQNPNEVFLRVAQRMMHWLNTPTHMGVLFRIDTQLQPEGSSGLLVSDWQRFVDYQQHQAWIWEQQALVRSRLILGPLRWHKRFKQLRNSILSQETEQKTLQQAIVEMRARMLEYVKSPRDSNNKSDNAFDLKKSLGGMIDIEFIVQYGVLSGAYHHALLLRYLDINHLCNDLVVAQKLSLQQAEILKTAYKVYLERVHRLALQNLPAVVGAEEYQTLRDGVKRVWEEVMH